MISLDNVSKSYGKQIFFMETCHGQPGEKVGLVGPNGAGKSTIFRIIMKEEKPDGGNVVVDRGVTIGYFRQDVGEMKGETVLEATLDGAGPVTEVARELKHLEHAMADPERCDEMDELIDALRRGAGALRRAGRLRAGRPRAGDSGGPGLSRGGGGRRRGRLSGGWKMRGGAGAHSADEARGHAAVTSPPTTWTWSRSSGWSSSSKATRARC